ncbi:hypothetical protein T459_17049 [Capsicum annuum]|uniref:non-specific serine/threonine protein kinase n=1 Tax=Capsicum annuum TaxID=4072 RepID=A0A2G2ZAF6_CAPAN|nr:hypothetical protein T459_17049 [Capsicum annuum]
MMYNGKSHHLKRRYNTVRELLSSEIITVDYVKSKDNVPDPLTKGLSREGVERTSKRMGLRPRTSQHGGSTLELVSRWNVWRNRNNNKDRWKIIPAAIWWKVLKIADFGLARLSYDTDTHVSTRVMGTFGYLAHEYALTGKLTEKSDVFSFGVMLLEIITRRWPIDKAQHYLDDNIVD